MQPNGAGGGPPRASTGHPGPGAYTITVILLGAALVALLWVPSYTRITPSLAGIPFFYWYSILWLLINAVCQYLAYVLIVILPRRRAAAHNGGAVR